MELSQHDKAPGAVWEGWQLWGKLSSGCLGVAQVTQHMPGQDTAISRAALQGGKQKRAGLKCSADFKRGHKEVLKFKPNMSPFPKAPPHPGGSPYYMLLFPLVLGKLISEKN